ncbi:MAG: GspH/FimT family pseudopilin [Rhodanobacter sp.]
MNELSRRSKGFTLVELMVTIAVVAILLAIALPSFRTAIQRNRVAAASNDLLASISYARTTAIYRHQLVSMCPSSTGSSCTSAGQAYEPGWIVYTYPAGAASANKAYAATSATLLRAIDSHAGVSINATETGIITFGLQGELRPATALVFLTCSRTGNSGTGDSTVTVPGVHMDVNGSGSVMTRNLPAVAASCGS